MPRSPLLSWFSILFIKARRFSTKQNNHYINSTLHFKCTVLYTTYLVLLESLLSFDSALRDLLLLLSLERLLDLLRERDLQSLLLFLSLLLSLDRLLDLLSLDLLLERLDLLSLERLLERFDLLSLDLEWLLDLDLLLLLLLPAESRQIWTSSKVTVALFPNA